MRRLIVRVLLVVLIGAAFAWGAAWEALAGDELDDESDAIRIAIAISQATAPVSLPAEGLPRPYDFRDSIKSNPHALPLATDAGKVVRKRQIVFLTAEWCGYCERDKKTEFPKLRKAGWRFEGNVDEKQDNAHIIVVDIDKRPTGWLDMYNPTALPTFVLCEDRGDGGMQEIDRHVGYMTANEIAALFIRPTPTSEEKRQRMKLASECPTLAPVKAPLDKPSQLKAAMNKTAGTLRHYAARWSWPGSLQNHLQTDHHVDTRGMSEADMKAAHDRIHDQIGPVRAHAAIVGRRQRCPGGKCP